jgi:hypothetical protein
MKTLKLIRILLFAGLIMAVSAEVGEQLSIPGLDQMVTTVQARVGRPLTPVSVAGVARRTVRRCAVGVYNCNFKENKDSDSLVGQAFASMTVSTEIWQRPVLALR